MPCLNCGHEIQENTRFCPRCGAPQAGSGPELGSGRSARILGNPYVRALRRYWWLLLVGVSVAMIGAIAAVYRIDFGSVPPSLEKRAQVTYTASARLLVTSAEAPYFRTTVPRVTEGPATEGEEPSTSTFMSAPDIGTLITTANLYPILIESDEVQEIRRRQFGDLPGSVTARAIYQIDSASRFELSQVPVIEVFGHAATYSGAVQLTQATVESFVTYIDQTQDRAGLERDERVLLQELQQPDGAVSSGGSSFSLPLMLFVVITAAFAVLALLLDRLFPFGLFPTRRLRSVTVTDGRAGHVEPVPEPELRAERSKAQV